MNEDKEYKLLLENLVTFASTKAGERVIWHLLSICNVYSDCYSGDNDTFYMLGKKAVGLELIDLLNQGDPTVYPRMLLNAAKESVEEENDDRN